MFINIDYNKRPKEVKLHLAKPNKRVISHIHEKFNDSLSVKLGNINELSFSIPHFILDEGTGSTIKNPHVDSIKEKMLIRVTLGTFKEWYIVDEIEEDSEDTDIFNVKAFSLGYELKGKRISNLVEESINATDLLTMLLETSVWKIGEVDPIFDGMFRSFDSSTDSNILDCIVQAGETYGALIVWDTIGRKVSFKDATKNGKFRGLTVSYGRFLQTLKRTRTTDEMVTRMYVYGSEDLTIHSVNPTGQGYIEDFSYFMYPFERDANKNVIKSSDFMSDELCHAILDHKILLEANTPAIRDLTDRLSEKQVELIMAQSDLDSLNLEMESILQLLDVARATEDEGMIQQRVEERDAQTSLIAEQEIVVNTLSAEVAVLELQLEQKQREISQQETFTQELLDELNLYVIESTWRDDRYINANELYNDALKKFEEIRQPKVVIEVSIDNLLNIVEEQYYWDKLNLGDLIKVRYKEMNIEYVAKIIEINYDFENGEATLTIANTTDLLSETEKLVQLLYNNASATSMVQNNKYKWDKINAVDKQVNELLTSEWDATKNKIIAGVNNSVEVGNRGIIIRNPDFPNEIVIMQSGVIALSKDAGETWKTAIKPDGIVAERLIGQIIAGQELVITNRSGSFTFDNNGVFIDASAFVVRSGTGRNMVQEWSSASDFYASFTDDNIITPYEKKILKTKWNNEVLPLYNANKSKIENYYEGQGEELDFVRNYYNRYSQLFDYLFITIHGEKPLLSDDNMTFSTRIDSADYNTVWSNYESARVEVETQLSLKAKELADIAQQDIENARERIEEVANDVVYSVKLFSTNGDKFNNGDIDTIVYVVVYKGAKDITDTLPNSSFRWRKSDRYGVEDVAWGNSRIGVGKQIKITKDDVDKKATFWCDIDIVQ